MIDAFFQCFREVYAADKALESYRKFYPNGNVFMINDGGNPDMEKISKKYNVQEYRYKENIGICHWRDPVEWFERFFEGLNHMETEFFVMQEEDVLHVRPVDTSKISSDISGTHPLMTLPQELTDYIFSETGNVRTYYAGGGGSIFRREFFENISKKDWRRHVVNVPHGWLHADIVLTFMTYLYGGSVEYCTECAEYDRPEYNSDPAIVHQYKENYFKNKILWVTCFRNIGRENWSWGSRPMEEYIECFKRLIGPLAPDLVCFTDESVPYDRTFPFDIADTIIPGLYERQKQILADPEFIRIVPEHLRGVPEYTTPDYSLTLCSKPSFLRRAYEMFPNYSHYAFIDFGYAKRAEDSPTSPVTKLSDKIVISSFRTFETGDELTMSEFCSENEYKYNWNNPKAILNGGGLYGIVGNLFIVPKKYTHWLESEMKRAIERNQEQGLVAGHDEPTWLSIIHDFRNRFDIRIKHSWVSWDWLI
jgi:hypothetical protein